MRACFCGVVCYLHFVLQGTESLLYFCFREYILLMDKACEDWGEGSGLQILGTDCNVREPGESNFVKTFYRIKHHFGSSGGD